VWVIDTEQWSQGSALHPLKKLFSKSFLRIFKNFMGKINIKRERKFAFPQLLPQAAGPLPLPL
jgi:hypothetical protein